MKCCLHEWFLQPSPLCRLARHRFELSRNLPTEWAVSFEISSETKRKVCTQNGSISGTTSCLHCCTYGCTLPNCKKKTWQWIGILPDSWLVPQCVDTYWAATLISPCKAFILHVFTTSNPTSQWFPNHTQQTLYFVHRRDVVVGGETKRIDAKLLLLLFRKSMELQLMNHQRILYLSSLFWTWPFE